MIVEDGTIVAGANSFCTLIDARVFADARGLTLPTDDTELEQALIKATDYVSSLENTKGYKGTRTDPATQELPWPRKDVDLYGETLDQNTIPQSLKNAVVSLTVDITAGIDFQATQDGRLIIKEGVGPLQGEYAYTSMTNGSADVMATPTAALAFLQPLFKYGNTGFIQSVIR